MADPTPVRHNHEFAQNCGIGCPAWDDLEWWEQIREVGRKHGFDFKTISMNGNSVDVVRDLDVETDRPILGKGSPNYSPHQKRVIESFNEKRDIYAERAAIYKDNYKVVGRVMQALFPDGAPRLYDAVDYDRWHIFELVIVKLTRYTNNWDEPHKDSLDDLQVYGAILGALDEELRERIRQQDEDQAEQDRQIAKLRETAERALGRDAWREQREEDHEAAMWDTDDILDKDEPVIQHEHVWKPDKTRGGVIICSCGASRRPIPDRPQG